MKARRRAWRCRLMVSNHHPQTIAEIERLREARKYFKDNVMLATACIRFVHLYEQFGYVGMPQTGQ